MNTKYIYFLIRKKTKNKGFTLIELLIVVLIIGILSAISIPSLVAQIGKARETEAKNNLGTMSRAQQAYHFENKVFADTLAKLAANATFQGKYYNYPDPDTATNSLLKQKAIPINSDVDRTKNYALGVYFNAGAYKFTLCEAQEVGSAVEAPDTTEGSCSNSGIEIN